MIHSQPPRALLRYDVCIVGSGPAGMTLARELAGSSLTFCVLESGGAKRSARGDALRRVVSDGIEIKSWSRERVLGGASTTWAGLSSPLDAVDLEPRPWMGASGWPLPREELLGLYGEAAERFGFAPPSAFAEFRRLRAKGDLQPAFERLDEKVFLAAEPPQDFGRLHAEVFEGEGRDLVLDATVVRLECDASLRAATAAVVKDGGGREWRLTARAFVLATGGIENARLLLESTELHPAGLGNEHDQVGRRLMNHPKNYRGILHLAAPVKSAPYWFGCLAGGFAGYAGLRLPEAVQRERRLANGYVRMEPLFPWSDDSGVESLVLLAKRCRVLLDAWKRRGRGGVVELRDYAETGDDSALQNERKGALGWLWVALRVLLHLPSVLHYAWYRLVPGQVPSIRRVRLRNFMEMEPAAENRVTLDPVATDVDGRPLPRVAHRPTALDRASMIAVHEALAAEVLRLGLGRLETDLATAEPWPIDQDASHHLGTTRMGTDPRDSVVDPDLKVHGVANVFAAGGSVFPTSGCANPTLTIVALSIRLARHLRTALGPARAAETKR